MRKMCDVDDCLVPVVGVSTVYNGYNQAFTVYKLECGHEAWRKK